MAILRQPLYDFSRFEHVESFRPINDAVMGGRSESRFFCDPEEQCAVFSGTVSLENGGGFASVRSEPFPRELAGCSRFVLGVAGDSKRYHFRVKTDPEFSGVVYDAPFVAAPGFVEVELPFEQFTAVNKGRIMYGVPPLLPAVIWSFGFLIGEKQEGPFELRAYFISAL